MMCFVLDGCQPITPLAIGIAGVAGSGKTTLGRALASALVLPLLDLDTLTNPLLEHLPDSALGGHWLASAHRSAVRDGRYAALRATAHDVVATAGAAVLVAPFTAELRGGPEWRALLDAVSPAGFRLIQMVGDADVFALRRAGRGEARDLHRPVTAPPDEPPAVPVIPIDADLTPGQQLRRARLGLGLRAPLDDEKNLLGAGFEAVLLDLDGTLADSTASVNRSWRRFTQEAGVSMEALHRNHGQPATVLLGKLLPPERASWGLRRITELELDDATTARALPGARAFLDGLPESARAVVTSGYRPVAEARMLAAGLPVPDVLVTADDVRHAKPDPEPYLLAARRLGVDPARCLVVEDAPAGIRSARAAGARVLAVSGTSPAEELSEADLVVDGLDRVTIGSVGGMLRLIDLSRRNAVERRGRTRDPCR